MAHAVSDTNHMCLACPWSFDKVNGLQMESDITISRDRIEMCFEDVMDSADGLRQMCQSLAIQEKKASVPFLFFF